MTSRKAANMTAKLLVGLIAAGTALAYSQEAGKTPNAAAIEAQKEATVLEMEVRYGACRRHSIPNSGCSPEVAAIILKKESAALKKTVAAAKARNAAINKELKKLDEAEWLARAARFKARLDQAIKTNQEWQLSIACNDYQPANPPEADALTTPCNKSELEDIGLARQTIRNSIKQKEEAQHQEWLAHNKKVPWTEANRWYCNQEPWKCESPPK